MVAVVLVGGIKPQHEQLSSVQDGTYALGKVHIRSTPTLGGLPNVAFETAGTNSEHCMNNMNSAGLIVHVWLAKKTAPWAQPLYRAKWTKDANNKHVSMIVAVPYIKLPTPSPFLNHILDHYHNNNNRYYHHHHHHHPPPPPPPLPPISSLKHYHPLGSEMKGPI